MADPSWLLQQALFAALDAALSIAVYDDAPQDAQRPFCYVGDDDLEADSSKGDDEEEAWLANVEIEVIDGTHAGRKIVKTTFGVIRAAIHDNPGALTVPGFIVNWCLYRSSSTSRAEDGQTYRGVTRYQIRLQENPA